MKKDRARRIFSARRDRLSPAARERAERRIEENLFALDGFREHAHYFIYLSFKSEVSTANIISRLINEGKKVYVPKIVNGKMIAAEISGGMENNAYGIAEPRDTIEAGKVDVCITPLLAADKSLYRVGYGKGYYDRFFAEHDCVKIGILYSVQKYGKNFKTESTDIPLDYAVSEKGTEKKEH